MRYVAEVGIVVLMAAILLTGCDRVGTAHVELTNPQAFLMPASPIRIDPAVPVSANESRRSYTWDGMDVVQRIEVSGWVKIVPDFAGPLRMPPGPEVHLPENVLRAWRERRSYYALVEIVDARLDPLTREATREDVRSALGEPLGAERWHPRDAREPPDRWDRWLYPSNRHVPYGSTLLVCFDADGRVADLGWTNEGRLPVPGEDE